MFLPHPQQDDTQIIFLCSTTNMKPKVRKLQVTPQLLNCEHRNLKHWINKH